jgi:hypothetical protein
MSSEKITLCCCYCPRCNSQLYGLAALPYDVLTAYEYAFDYAALSPQVIVCGSCYLGIKPSEFVNAFFELARS